MKIFERIWEQRHRLNCPSKLQSMIEYFHTDTKRTVQFNGSSSEPFEIRIGVKQGCVLVPTFFWIFFAALLLKHAFDTATEGINCRTQSDGRLFNLARLKSKTNVREVNIRDMQLRPTPRRNSSHWWTVSHGHVKIQD